MIISLPFGSAESSAPVEVAAKLALVRATLADLGAPAIVLTTAGAVAWLTAGLENRIESGSTASAMWIVVSPDEAIALTTNVERARIAAEHNLRHPYRGWGRNGGKKKPSHFRKAVLILN